MIRQIALDNIILEAGRPLVHGVSLTPVSYTHLTLPTTF